MAETKKFEPKIFGTNYTTPDLVAKVTGKARYSEDWRVEGNRLAAVESRVEGSGAGMDPPPGARLADGMWHWRPALAPLPELRLTLSPYTADYRLCTRAGCAPLHALVHAPADRIEVVTVRPCTG